MIRYSMLKAEPIYLTVDFNGYSLKKNPITAVPNKITVKV